MSKLSEKSLKILEYYTILDQLAEKCVSRKAKQAARSSEFAAAQLPKRLLDYYTR